MDEEAEKNHLVKKMVEVLEDVEALKAFQKEVVILEEEDLLTDLIDQNEALEEIENHLAVLEENVEKVRLSETNNTPHHFENDEVFFALPFMDF